MINPVETPIQVGTCALEIAQTAGQCNEYLFRVAIVFTLIGAFVATLAIHAGAWYRARKE